MKILAWMPPAAVSLFTLIVFNMAWAVTPDTKKTIVSTQDLCRFQGVSQLSPRTL